MTPVRPRAGLRAGEALALGRRLPDTPDPLALYAALVAAAYALLDRRDLGSGVLPSRPGPDRSPVRTAGALTRRLARGTLVGWVVAYVVLGVVLGSIAGSATAPQE